MSSALIWRNHGRDRGDEACPSVLVANNHATIHPPTENEPIRTSRTPVSSLTLPVFLLFVSATAEMLLSLTRPRLRRGWHISWKCFFISISAFSVYILLGSETPRNHFP